MLVSHVQYHRSVEAVIIGANPTCLHSAFQLNELFYPILITMTSAIQKIMMQHAPEVLTDKDIRLAPTKKELDMIYGNEQRERLYIPELLEEEIEGGDELSLPTIDYNPIYAAEELPGFTFDKDSHLDTQSTDSLESPLYHVEGIDIPALHFTLSTRNKDKILTEIDKRDEPIVKSSLKQYFKEVTRTTNSKEWYDIKHMSNGKEVFDELVQHNPDYKSNTYYKHQNILIKAKVALKNARAEEKSLFKKSKQAREARQYTLARMYDTQAIKVSSHRRRLSELLDNYNKLDNPVARRTKRIKNYLPKFVARQQRMLANNNTKQLEKYSREDCVTKVCGKKPQLAA